MSWRDAYRAGSFRGAGFRTAQSDREGGRRGVLHEFPARDLPWYEDLGPASKSFRLTCWVAGDEYRTARDALEAALDGEGPGLLIHPFKGRLVCAVPRYTVRESTDEGGYAEFDIEFAETSGTPQGPVASADTAAQAQAASADAVARKAPARFADRFSVDGLPGFIEDASVELVEAAALAAQIAAAPMGGAGAALRAFDAGLRLLPASARSLVRRPLALAQAVLGLIHSIGALHSDAPRRAAAMRTMAEFGRTLEPVSGQTFPRLVQARNQSAFVSLVRIGAAAGLVDALSRQSFASAEDAIAARSDAAGLIETLARDAADALDDESWATLRALRDACIRDLTTRSATLVRSYAHTPAATEPALVTARRLTDETAAIDARADDLVARNRIRHPAFVPGGTVLTVLQESAA